MDKYNVEEFSSMGLIHNGDGGIIIPQYDDGYPKEKYRLRGNMIGGAQNFLDKGPGDTFRREVIEEIQRPSRSHLLEQIKRYKIPKGTNVGNFAPIEIIDAFRNAVLINYEEGSSFYSDIKAERGAPVTYFSVDSSYFSQIDKGLFDEVANRISVGERFSTEGGLVVTTIDELKSGDVLTAWSSPSLIGDYYGTKLPNPENNKATKLRGRIKERYSDYSEIVKIVSGDTLYYK